MANQRESPFIWVSWLSKVMAGEVSCHWQTWFQTHNQLTEKQPSDFNLANWKIKHTKLLTELKEKLIEEKMSPLIEREIRYQIPESNTTIKGKIDCKIEKDDEIIVYDCKTGNERTSDQTQVMIYMYLLSKKEDKKIKGKVIYNEREIEINELPKDFEEDFNYFINILASENSPVKNPGSDCKFCDITKQDCPERED